jgi:hypothetical protein
MGGPLVTADQKIELGVLREAVERFYRVDGYPAAMQVVRAAESLLAASPATADRTDGDAS